MSLLLFEGNSPDWMQGMNPQDFALVCPNMNAAVPIDRFADCHLAEVPAHAVVTRPEIHSKIVSFLKFQEVSKIVFSLCLFFYKAPDNTSALCLIHLMIGDWGGNKKLCHAAL